MLVSKKLVLFNAMTMGPIVICNMTKLDSACKLLAHYEYFVDINVALLSC